MTLKFSGVHDENHQNLQIYYQMEDAQEYSSSSMPSINIKHRKLTMNGTSTVFYPDKKEGVFPRQFLLQVPQQKTELAISLRIIEEDFYKKHKMDNNIKTLLKAYEDNRKRNWVEGMNNLGLEVLKIKSYTTAHSFSNRKNQSQSSFKQVSLNKIQQTQLSPLKVYPNLSQNQFNVEKIVFNEDDRVNLKIGLHQKNLRQKRIFKRQKKAEQYLYKRLEGSERAMKQQQNLIYDKRIKSYLQFLWKNMLSHNIYLNLDLSHDDINNRSRKLKAYIAPGNNGAMVAGLIKRRFWWTITNERTPDCDFIWTQIKIQEVFDNQKQSSNNRRILKEEMQERQVKNKFSMKKTSYENQHLFKLLNSEDLKIYKNYVSHYQSNGKQREYAFKVDKIGKILSILQNEQGQIIHNHLPNNFHLGNKKALFYNLRQYYTLIGQNCFDYIPLTFHIKRGFRDPQYIRFLDYYRRRQRTIEKERKKDESFSETQRKVKLRNIWIVKPGQNSNQGRGITVIDEIYELNSLMKQSSRQEAGEQQEVRTYIIQMYIDRPMLYNNRKFDIRHYMLITNFFGITRAYWYQQGYIRTSSYQFDITNFEPQIHLTNDAVQKKFPDYHKYQPYNKISYEEFQRYLDMTYPNKKYNFKGQILPQMKKMANYAARSVFTTISPNNLMNNFEIFGLDFMIDSNFKPWLIEINTNPCLQCNSPLLNRIIPYMVQQSFKLTLDLAYPPPTHYPNTSKHYAPLITLDNFKYELIFDSQTEGDDLRKIFRKGVSITDQIGQIQQDEVFKDDGKECKLQDFT